MYPALPSTEDAVDAIQTPLSTTKDCASERFQDMLADAGRGDPQALDELLNRIGAPIARYCRVHHDLHGSAHTSGEALARTVCSQVVAALPGYQPQHQHFLAFVYTIACRTADAASKSMALPQPPDRHRTAPITTRTDAPAPADRRTQLRTDSHPADITSLLTDLPDNQREILVLRVVNGLTAEQAAQATGQTPGAVRLLQHRALTQLRGATAPAAEKVPNGRARLQPAREETPTYQPAPSDHRQPNDRHIVHRHQRPAVRARSDVPVRDQHR